MGIDHHLVRRKADHVHSTHLILTYGNGLEWPNSEDAQPMSSKISVQSRARNQWVSAMHSGVSAFSRSTLRARWLIATVKKAITVRLDADADVLFVVFKGLVSFEKHNPDPRAETERDYIGR